MKIRLKRLNSSGVAHHFLIALIAIVIVAGFGAYKVFFSKASTGYTVRSSVVKVANSEGCWLAGRVWSNNDCLSNKCRDTGDVYKTKKGSDGVTRGYCVNAVAVSVSTTDCKNYQRRYVYELGCARKVNDKDALGALQCIYSNHTYFSALSPDVCKLVCPAGNTISNNTCVAPAPTPAQPQPTTTTTQSNSQPSGSTTTGSGPTCISDTTGSGTNLSAGQTCPVGTHSLCANNAAPVNGSCPENAINTSIPGIDPIKSCPNNGTIQANGLCPGGVAPTISCASGLVNGTDGKCHATVGSNSTPQKCSDGSNPDAQGNCKKETTIAAPPLANIVAVDATMNKKDCLLVGREWIGKANAAGQQKGCSKESCNKQKDSLVANDGKPFCKSAKFDKAYAVRLSKKECTNLHRQFIEQIGVCAQVPNQERKNKEVVNADQCVGAYSTYYIRPGIKDECFKPDFFNRAQAVAKKVGSPLGGVLKAGPAAYCNAKSGWHWDSAAKECKKDRKKASSGNSTSGTQSSNSSSDTNANYTSSNAAEGGINFKSCTDYETLTSSNLSCPPYRDETGTVYCYKDSGGMSDPPTEYHSKGNIYTWACK